MRFILRQKLFSLRDVFQIKDEHDNLAFEVVSKLLTLKRTFIMRDAHEREVAKIKRKFFSIRPTLNLTFADGSTALLRKKFFSWWFTSKFYLSYQGRSILIVGDFLSHEYDFFIDDQPIASVSKKWFSFTDTYGVDIAAPKLAPLILSCVVIIDELQHSDNGYAGD